MMNSSNISDRIRRQLEQPAGVGLEVASALAAEYSSQVYEVNERLSNAVQLLKKGLRSEAIQLANVNPNALDRSSELDFPELDDWIAILQFLDVEVPPLIDRDSAHQLQQAILEEQPLEELLRQHRRLAIAKAPLSWRLKVLRRIRNEDSLNTVWTEDVESWETLRLKQLPSEVTAAIKSKDFDECEELATELSTKDWLINPPDELLQKIESATNDLKYKSQIDQLNAIAERLHNAYAETNEPAARQHRKSWNASIASLVRAAPIETVHAVEPALEWLKQCDESERNVQLHEAACARLSKLLEESSDLSELDQAFLSVHQHNLGIDPILEQKYATKTHQLRLGSKRKLQLSFFAATLIAVCVVAGLAFWQMNRSFNQAVSGATSELQAMLDKQMWNEAEAFTQRIKNESPRILQNPSVSSLVTKLEGSLAQEKLRQEEWAKLISQAHDGTAESVDQSALLAAERIAKLPEELNRTREVRRVFDRAETKLQQLQFEKVHEITESADDELLTIERSALSPDLYPKIDAVLERIAKARNEFSKCGSRGTSLLDSVDKRGRALHGSIADQLAKTAQRESALKGLKIESDVTSYTRALENYVKNFTGAPMSREFSIALNDKDTWGIPFEWNAWLEQFNNARSSGLDESRAGELLVTLKEFENRVPVNLALKAMPKLDAYLQNFSGRHALIEQIASDLSKSILNDLAMAIGNVDGNTGRYYIYDTYRVSKEDAWKKLTDVSRSAVEVMARGTGEVSSVMFKGAIEVRPYPKTAMSSLARMVNGMKPNFESECDANICKLIKEISGTPDIDSMVKQVLLLNILDALAANNNLIRQDLSGINELLQESRDSLRSWQKPVKFDSQLPEKVAREIEKCTRQIQQRIAAENASIKRLTTLRYEWIGGIERESSGAARLWTRTQNLPDGYLVLASPQIGSPGKFKIERIGLIDDKQPSLQGDSQSLVAGKPVFLMTMKIGTE